MQIDKKDRISFKYLLKSAVNGEVYDCDIDRWLGVYVQEKQEIKKNLKEMLCQK